MEVLWEEVAEQKTHGWQSFQPTHTSRINMRRQMVQDLRRLSLASRLAEVEHARARSVVRTVVKSHRSKGADTFDQLCQGTARGVWEACNSSHMLTSPSDVVGLQEHGKDGW